MIALSSWIRSAFASSVTTAAARAAQPAGHVDSVVALQATLFYGMSEEALVLHAGSPGQPVDGAKEDVAWTDRRGNRLEVTLRRGKVVRWTALGAADAQGPLQTPDQLHAATT